MLLRNTGQRALAQTQVFRRLFSESGCGVRSLLRSMYRDNSLFVMFYAELSHLTTSEMGDDGRAGPVG